MEKKSVYYIDKKLVIVIENVLSKEECDELIKLSEKNEDNYTVAKIDTRYKSQVVDTRIRNSDRWINDDFKLSKELFEKIKKYLPLHSPKDSRWILTCLNERLRFLRYKPGQKFLRHCDGNYVRPDASEKSFFTAQFYLNVVESGGETTFFSQYDGSNRVAPKPGSVLIFEQDNLVHEGSEVKAGLKYVIRTDVMYKRILDEEDDFAFRSGWM